MRIIIIGAGNVATHIALALKRAGLPPTQIWSRTTESAQALAESVGCLYTNCLDDIITDADACIISVKDRYVKDIAAQVCKGRCQTVFMHTSGSVGLDVFNVLCDSCGVLYPMQTFSKEREVDFMRIPCFIEASDNSGTMDTIAGIANHLSANVQCVDSEKRKRLHLAAVFANNFTNHCYRLAEKMLEGTDVDFSTFLPIIEETAKKVSKMSPRNAQTGPMVRNDVTVMERQLNLIPDERTKKLYRLMAESIHEDSKK